MPLRTRLFLAFVVASAVAIPCACSTSSPDAAVNAPAGTEDGGLTGTQPPNPNGAWSYGFYKRELSNLPNSVSEYPPSFERFTEFVRESDAVTRWARPGHRYSLVRFNTTTQKLMDGTVTLLPGVPQLHPEENVATVLRYTAPSRARYAIDVTFTNGDPKTTTSGIVIAAGRMLDGKDTGFHLTTSEIIREGDSIDFVVVSKGQNFYDSTNVDAKVQKLEAVDGEAPDTGADGGPTRALQCIPDGETCVEIPSVGYPGARECCGQCQKGWCTANVGTNLPCTKYGDRQCPNFQICGDDGACHAECPYDSCSSDANCCSYARCVSGRCTLKTLAPGAVCTHHRECASELCLDGHCYGPNAGASCKADAECTSGHCAYGRCTDTSIGDRCEESSVCSSQICAGGACACLPTNAPCNGYVPFHGCCGVCTGRLDGSSACQPSLYHHECKTDEGCATAHCVGGQCVLVPVGGKCGNDDQCITHDCRGGVCACAPPSFELPNTVYEAMGTNNLQEPPDPQTQCCYPHQSSYKLRCGGLPPGSACTASNATACGSATCTGSECVCSMPRVKPTNTEQFPNQCEGDADCCSGKCQRQRRGTTSPVSYGTYCCAPGCAPQQCGVDACGTSCGYRCPSGTKCDGSQCVACTPNCAGRNCGSDGCSGHCGYGWNCPSGQTCSSSGVCTSPQQCTCTGRVCGVDSCGKGSCGTCPSGQACDASGQCISTNGGGGSPAPSFCQANDASECLTVDRYLYDANYCTTTGRGNVDVLPVLHNTCSAALWCRVCGDANGTPVDCQEWRFQPGESLGGWTTPFTWCDVRGVRWACSPYYECVDGK